MPFVNLSFRIHVPLCLRNYTSLDVEASHQYFDKPATIEYLDTLADECFIPATKLLLKLAKQFKGRFKISFSISGTALELLQQYRPDVLEQLKKLNKTNCVEFYGETYHHSLVSLYSVTEFAEQIQLHKEVIKKTFGKEPLVFRNTELIHNNSLATVIQRAGFTGVLCEGAERILKGRNCNRVYAAPGEHTIKIIVRNQGLSDDLAFRFDEKSWNEYPLTAEKYASWIHTHEDNAEVITLFFDYATLGAHKKKETGIFDFFEALPDAVLSNEAFCFATPSEIIDQTTAGDVYNVTETISWKDKRDECCVWCENMMQNNMLRKIYSLQKSVMATKDSVIIDTWRKLQLADYFYYMAE
ncbi:MAG TPA: glycoside hydrolase family 57 protein, partial [Lacibacter sp.]|nr:glycoside hydrolase family 57 protein [Lacibacter sp.]